VSEQLQIPVELEVEAVKRYVMGETLTPYNFDLLQNYFEGRIIKLIRDRVAGAKEYGQTGQITAMQRSVSFEDLEAISEAIIYGINKENK
jgi:hypothetical protein